MNQAFGLDKVKVKQSFADASLTYDSAAALQCEVGRLLLDTFNSDLANGVLLDIGCGTGFLLQEWLLSHEMTVRQDFVAIDIAMPMLQHARNKLAQPRFGFVCADAESLPFAHQSIELVISNLALQWSRQPESLFNDLRRIIKLNGQLQFSTFGPQTLQELKAAWKQVDNYCHVNEFYSKQELMQILQQSGFKDIQIYTHVFQQTYPTVVDLMRELKALGAHNVSNGRKKQMTTKTQIHSMIAAYEKCRIRDGIPATFEALLVYARV